MVELLWEIWEKRASKSIRTCKLSSIYMGKKYKHKPNKARKYLTKIANKNPLLFHYWKVGILPMTR